MQFLSGVWKRNLAHLFTDGTLGLMCRPGNSYRPADALVWAADNGCFGKGYPGDDGYLAWLAERAEHRLRCLFATAPDVPGNPAATIERSLPLLPEIRRAGYRAALVAQNGLRGDQVPWDAIDVLFTGGLKECQRCRYIEHSKTAKHCPTCSRRLTEWKLGHEAAVLLDEAKERGKGTHIGRVNFAERMRYVRGLDCVDSIDGTRLAFGADKNLPQLLAALGDPAHQGVLV